MEKPYALIADHLGEDDDVAGVVVGIETDRVPWVQALLAAGYTVYAINLLQAARHRDRHGISGVKSDPGDALVLAGLVRTDRALHRPITGDSTIAGQVKVLARAHQSLIWARRRAQINILRSGLREYYPAALAAFGAELAGRDAVAVLTAASGPAVGALHGPHLPARPGSEAAYTATTGALIAVITALTTQFEARQEQLQQCFGRHPDLGTTAASLVSVSFSVPGCSPNSGTSPMSTPMRGPGRTTPSEPDHSHLGQEESRARPLRRRLPPR